MIRRIRLCKHFAGPMLNDEGQVKQVKVVCSNEAVKERYEIVYQCKLHKRCILYNPQDNELKKWRGKWESNVYSLCQTCPDFSCEK